jgi:2-polyprenyl-3-methyl-5-hydroxy-6-metoxy-1,4-benzoquinol methylase
VQPCPICGHQEKKAFLCKVTLVFGSEYDLLQCNQCRAAYFEPLPTIEQLERFYSASYYNFDRWHEEAKGAIYARKLKKLKRGGTFLDVGCASGFFIHGITLNSDWKVYGVDFGEAAIRYARDTLGLNVEEGDLRNAAYPEQFFDYIHINNVLEHVLDPVSLLEECRRIIKPDGHLFLSVPNGYNDSRNLIAFHESEHLPARSVSGHIFFFARDTLLMLFQRMGFAVEKKKTGSLKRGLRNVGYLAKKKHWKEDYSPRKSPEVEAKSDIVIQPKKYPELYYRYRYLQSRLHDIPGLHDFGLDFVFLLRPSR